MKKNQVDGLQIRKFLSKYLVYHFKIKYIEKAIEEQKIKAENQVKAVTYDKEKTAKTNRITDPNEAVDDYIDNEKRYIKILNDYQMLNQYISVQIDKLDNPEYKDLLKKIYVDFVSFFSIRKNYKIKNKIYIDYDKALSALTKIFVLDKKIEKLLPDD